MEIAGVSPEEVGRLMMRPLHAVSRSAQPVVQRHLIRRLASLLAALAAASYGVMTLAPAASAGTAASAAPGARAAHPRIPAAPHVAGAPDLGPNVYVFTPSMPQSQIQATVDAIASQQVPNQFGTQRYALLFEPGTYGTPADPLIFQVGYYTQVAGLGASPDDVVINGSVDVYNQCFPSAPGTTNCIALDNFWRSLSNLSIHIAGGSGCQTQTEFWAVSQAAPMRRVDISGGTVSFMDYCSAGPQFASGGFVADSQFTGGTIVNGSQQQFIVRNSNLESWTNGVWNQVFSGDNGAPPQAFGVPGGAGPYTTLPTSPVTQEEPYLYQAAGGTYRVFVPAVQHDSSGPTWTNGAAAGRSVPISQFFIATPATPVGRINGALASGRNLILTPGVYHLGQAIDVRRPDTVVLGLGVATLIPDRGNAAMQVASVPGVKVSGLMVDAGRVNSRVLVQIGSRPGGPGSAADPTLLQDVYFRIGGAEPGKATDSLVVNSSHVILDNIWAWRADHGDGVGWTSNTADHGLVVTGNDVTAYGLFVEHYQKTEVIWSGQGGTDIFFQNEMPYDPPSQAAWMADAKTDGYPAFAVTGNVRSFTGYGLGSYCFFNQGLPIEATEAFQAPATAPGVRLHDLLTVFLSGSGSIDSVIDGTGAPVTSATAGTPSNVVSFP
jgi:hypothetical protein